MRADGGVNATVGLFGLKHDVVQGFAHSMQALKLKCLFRGVQSARHFENSGDGMGVMSRKLRVQERRMR